VGEPIGLHVRSQDARVLEWHGPCTFIHELDRQHEAGGIALIELLNAYRNLDIVGGRIITTASARRNLHALPLWTLPVARTQRDQRHQRPEQRAAAHPWSVTNMRTLAAHRFFSPLAFGDTSIT